MANGGTRRSYAACAWSLCVTHSYPDRLSLSIHVAEGVGFEPTMHCCTLVFKTSSIGRSDSPPCCFQKKSTTRVYLNAEP